MKDEVILARSRIEQLESMLGEMVEMGRMRSDFALEHFVVGSHDTPGRQRAQALAEMQSLYFSLADVYDDLQLAQLELEQLTGDGPRVFIERRKLERKITGYVIHLTQRVKEIDYLMKLLERLPRYTAESLEAEEKEYWSRRLPRQAFLAARDPGGNLDAILQMVTTPGIRKPQLPMSAGEWLNSLGLSERDIATGLLNSGMIDQDTATRMITEGGREKAEGGKRKAEDGRKRRRK